MKVSTWILSMAAAVAASVCAVSPAWAVQLQNITVNGQPYSEGMVAPAADVLTLSGNIVTEPLDDFNNWYLGGSYKESYAGVGFFATGSASCVIPVSSGLLTTPSNPDAQMYWPDPARCVPTFSIAATVDTTNNLYAYPLTLKFDQSSGAFTNIKVPVAAVSGSETFTITYQLNHWSWPSPVDNSQSIWPDNTSLASVRWSTSAPQYFKPQATLTFKKSSAASVRKISAVGTDNKASLTVLASVIPAGSEAGRSQKIWLAAKTPSAGWFFKNASGTWVAMTDSSDTAIDALAYLTGVQAALSFPILDHQDVTGLVGTELYVGYGVDPADVKSTSGKWVSVYTIR